MASVDNINQVLMCMSCHKAIMAITKGTHIVSFFMITFVLPHLNFVCHG